MTQTTPFDVRRKLARPGNKAATLRFATQHWLDCARSAIAERGAFFVALSGGSTPKAIFSSFQASDLDWTKVWLFWSDERAVPEDDKDSNYRMAMEQGLGQLGIPPEQIFRMQAEDDIEDASLAYERVLENQLPGGLFDLVMLGMGDDGHTASLFPRTHALHSGPRTVVENYIPKLDAWRMTLSFEGIHKARHIAVYVLGSSKAEMLKLVLEGEDQPDKLPAQRIGTPERPALWIVDDAAAAQLSC